jgi:hypothetical protein
VGFFGGKREGMVSKGKKGSREKILFIFKKKKQLGSSLL